MLAPKAQEHNIWPEKVFSTNNPPPHWSSQNDQRNVGIILSHRCWVDPPPPARQVGRPRPEPPPPVQAAKEGGDNGLLCPPPAEQFSSRPWGGGGTSRATGGDFKRGQGMGDGLKEMSGLVSRRAAVSSTLKETAKSPGNAVGSEAQKA